MSLSEEIIDAVLEPDGTLRLAQQSQMNPGPVRVIISAQSARHQRTLADVIREIAASQRAHVFPGRSAEELNLEEAAREEEDDERGRELTAARRS
jgi:hypothetical protein